MRKEIEPSDELAERHRLLAGQEGRVISMLSIHGCTEAVRSKIALRFEEIN